MSWPALGSRAEQLLEHSAPKQKILVLAGRGSNGEDASATIQHILARNPALLQVEDPEEALPELHGQLASRPALILDGLFGIGLNRPLSEAWKRLINVVNESGIPIVALDVPSGLNADTGLPEGAAIQATWTITLGAPKAGLLKNSAAPFVGELMVLPDIGLSPMPNVDTPLWWTERNDFRGYPPSRPVQSHKGDFGHAVLVAGSPGYHGAAVLASRGAQRAHPGLVTVVTHEWVYFPVASQTQAAMVRAWKPQDPLPAKTTAVLYGPGLGAPDQHDLIKQEVQRNWMKLLPNPSWWMPPPWIGVPCLELRDDAPGVRVITPHPGEAARLLGLERRGGSRRPGGGFAQAQLPLRPLLGCSQRQPHLGGPFDGSDSRQQAPATRCWARVGSGDLLAGFITGLLAQPGLQADPARVLAFAVWGPWGGGRRRPVGQPPELDH